MNIKKLLNEYYSRTYERWRIKKEKAGKDIVGEEYELMRKKFWTQHGFKAQPENIGGYDADLVVRTETGRIVVIEESKAHYVDSCFLDRFVMNAGRVLQHYIDLEIPEEDIPYISLSCMTSYRLYEQKLKDNKRMFSTELQEMMGKKIKYFPICAHDRVRKGKYFKNTDVSFEFSDGLILNQTQFVESLKEIL